MQPEVTVAHLERMEAVRTAAVARRAEALRGSLPAAAALLRSQGADGVWVFGSLVAGDVHRLSDVDLAVRGLPDEVYFRTLSHLVALFDAEVDLVQLEGASPSLRAHIETEGRPL